MSYQSLELALKLHFENYITKTLGDNQLNTFPWKKGIVYWFIFTEVCPHVSIYITGLIYCCPHILTWIWVNIGSGNGFLLTGTKPLPEPMLINHPVRYCGMHMRAISQELHRISITDLSLKITNLRSQMHILGAGGLSNCLVPNRWQHRSLMPYVTWEHRHLGSLKIADIWITKPEIGTYIGISKLGHHWTLLAYCTLNCTLGNKGLWSLNQNTIIFILRNEFENVTCKVPYCLATMYFR